MLAGQLRIGPNRIAIIGFSKGAGVDVLLTEYPGAYHACVEKGPQVASNQPAHEATVKAVKEMLAATFGMVK